MGVRYSGPSEAADDVIETTGALLVGRHTYEVEDRDRGGFYGGAWTGPFFVLTHEPPTTRPAWMTGTFINESIESAVTRAKTAAGAKNVVVLGSNIAEQCLDAGVLDEILVHIAPVLIGDGVRLFARRGGDPIKLEKTFAAGSAQLTDLRFRVLK
ncbi:MAG: dihydrofolate reductase family protein [Actinobacteria bacterium]|nr:dihydrofolate reductase family protein [Actinomycetota bacterium]